MTREEAINEIKSWDFLEGKEIDAIHTLVHELAESEDKRIINAIISYLRRTSLYSSNGCKKPEMIDWLEKQKEQHHSSRFLPNDWVVYDGPLGHAILQVKDVVGGRYTFVDNDSTLLVEDSDKFLRPLTPKDVEKPAEWSEGNYDIISNISNQVYKAIRRTLASLAVYDEDEELLESREATLSYYSQQCAEEILKSLPLSRPKSSDNWKPSEEQKEALEYVIRDYREDGCNATANYLQEILDHLKNM